jgi:hypothetical protein
MLLDVQSYNVMYLCGFVGKRPQQKFFFGVNVKDQVSRDMILVTRYE